MTYQLLFLCSWLHWYVWINQDLYGFLKFYRHVKFKDGWLTEYLHRFTELQTDAMGLGARSGKNTDHKHRQISNQTNGCTDGQLGGNRQINNQVDRRVEGNSIKWSVSMLLRGNHKAQEDFHLLIVSDDRLIMAYLGLVHRRRHSPRLWGEAGRQCLH